MNEDRELKRTAGFAIAAVALSVVAGMLSWASAPPTPSEFTDIGEQFYEDFTDPSEATRLRLASWNDELAKTDVFEVKFTPENGWTIPSHNDYPADGEEQLSKTAASIVGIERGGLMPGRKDDHGRYGVIDPLDQSVTGTEGRGSRLTLWKGDTVLADYVIGKRVEEGDDTASSGEALYYIRKVGDDAEDRVYRAALDIDVSTDFADWIEPDLLQIGSVSDIRRIVIDRYQVDEQTGRVAEGDKSVVSRESATDSWKLEGMNEETESLVTGTVSGITTALDDLRIIGVRKKPALLTAQLKKQELKGFNQLDVMQMQSDLQAKGFFLDQSGVLVSNEGDFTAGTGDGVSYTLRFGEVFTGSKASLETGTAADEDAAEKENEKTAESTDESAESDDESESNVLKGRYVFITVDFDETLLTPVGDAPVKPEPPAKPDGKAEADAADDADAGDGDKPENKPAGESDASEKESDPADDPEYKQALADYDLELEAYNQKKSDFDKKVEDGKKRVDELSARFADWYYVIDAETFDKLAVDRADLAEPKEASAGESAGTDPVAPGLPLPDGDAAAPATGNGAKPEMKADPVDETASPEAESKPAEPSPDDAKPEMKKEAESSTEEPASTEPAKKEETPAKTEETPVPESKEKAGEDIPPSVPLPEVIPGKPAEPASGSAE